MTSGMTKKILSYFDRKINNYKKDRVINDVKYLGFSGHELNILAYLKHYKMTSMDCHIEVLKGTLPKGEICEEIPKFAANIIWELSKDQNKNHYVRTYYNGIPIKRSCFNPDEEEYCEYNDWVQFMKEKFTISESNEKKVCKDGVKNPNFERDYTKEFVDE